MAVNLAAPVLVVDDHPAMVGILTALLTRLGFTAVEGFGDALSAWKRLQNGPCALVVCDWNMAPTSGHDLLKQVRGRDGARTPFILVSGESSADRVIEARRAGADNFLVKPFDAATLKIRLTEVLGELPMAAVTTSAP